ncbi:MAG: LytTR family DNA-binding domain-containing protein [Pseudomonadota bacterium]|nr:LytTR family DNA-binding domain-containing protein [Pseudomonadota bacterium]
MNTRITALVAANEPPIGEQLIDLLRELWPALDIVATVANGDAALQAFAAHHPSVAFLDISMPGRSGVDVASRIAPPCHVVFLTAHDDYSIEVFRTGVVAYVLKPVDRDRLAETVLRLKRNVHAPPPDLTSVLTALRAELAASTQHLKWLKAAVGRMVKLIPIDDVVYFQADNKYTRVVMRNGEALIRTSLRGLLDGLDPGRFWQIHRGTIVNAATISGLLRDDEERHYFVLLKDRPDRLPVSRQYLYLFKQM